jgi:zinc protease
MVDEISPADIQKLAADILRQNHRIEVTMLSAK